MGLELFKPRGEIRINGLRRTLVGGTTTGGTRSAFSTATLTLDIAEGRPQPGDTVEVFGGTGYVPEIVFTGEIDTGGVTLAPNELEIRCTGILSRTRERITEPPTVVDGEAEQEPVVTYEGETASAIIGDLCDRYGIARYSLEDSGKTWGNLEPIGLMPGDNGWDLIAKLDEAEGYRTFDGPDGTVRRVEFSGLPGTVGRTYQQGVDLYAGRLDESRTGTYNRVTATGLPQTGTTGVDFVPADTLSAPSPWIPSPPTYRAYSYASDLFETGDECSEYAARKLGELNRLRGELPFELAVGDATLRPGMTVAIDASRLDVRGGARFWVEEVQHDFSEGFNTAGTLLLASVGSGWSANQAPIAIIATTIFSERLANGDDLTEIALDGSASYDPELGKAGIVSYVWSGSPTTPTPTGDGTTAVLSFVGGVPDGATVTLTVTDDLGKTGRTTIALDDPNMVVNTRDIIAAVATALIASRDGQKTWAEITVAGAPIAAVGVTEFAAAEYGLAWDAAGNLYKFLVDNTATLCPTVTGCTAASIALTNADPETPSGRCWAGSSDGRVWFSADDGDTWSAKSPAPNGGQVNHISESPFQDGDIELAAGNVAYRSFDQAGAWAAEYTHPNAALAATRIATGFGQGWIGFGGPDGDDGGASRLVERDDDADLNWPEPSKPASVVGLTMAINTPYLYLLDVSAAGLGRAWGAASDASGTLATLFYNQAQHGPPRHLVRDGRFPGLLYIAARDELAKSNDGLLSTLSMKALSGGQEGWMIGYGALRLQPPPPRVVGTLTALAAPMAGTTWQTAEKHVIRLTATGWVDLGTIPIATDYTYTRLLRYGTGKYIAWNYVSDDTGAAPVGANCVISTDDCATWQDSGLTGVISVAATEAGVLYALVVSGAVNPKAATIVRSMDDGAIWDGRSSYPYSNTAVIVFLTQIAVNPTDHAQVAVKTSGGIRVSTDGGASFSDVIGPGQSAANIHTGAILGGALAWIWTSNSPASTSPIRHYTYSGAAFANLTPEAWDLAIAIQRFDTALYIPGDDVVTSTDGGETWAATGIAAQDVVPQSEGALALSRTGSVGGFGPYTYSDFWVRRDAEGAETDLTAQQLAQLGVVYRAWPGSTTD